MLLLAYSRVSAYLTNLSSHPAFNVHKLRFIKMLDFVSSARLQILVKLFVLRAFSFRFLSRKHISLILTGFLTCLHLQERDTERQQVDELLEMNLSLEADLRHRRTSKGSVPASIISIHERYLQSELDSDEELAELIGQRTHLFVAFYLRETD